MTLRECLGTPGNPCRALTTGSRCTPCQRIVDNARSARRGTTAERGLSGAHARVSQHYKDANASCVCAGECGRHEGVCGRLGTPDNPITAGHIQARVDGGTSHPSNYRPECRRCNSSKQHR